MFTQIRGAANTKAKRELGWRLLYTSWREGFRRGLSDVPLPPGTAARLLGLLAEAGRERL